MTDHRTDRGNAQGVLAETSYRVPTLGRLLLQNPLRREWKFPSGAIGRHNPELRRALQGGAGE